MHRFFSELERNLQIQEQMIRRMDGASRMPTNTFNIHDECHPPYCLSNGPQRSPRNFNIHLWSGAGNWRKTLGTFSIFLSSQEGISLSYTHLAAPLIKSSAQSCGT